MKKQNTKILILAFSILLTSCATFSELTRGSAGFLSELGILDSKQYDSIIDATNKTQAASEKFTPTDEYYVGRGVAASILSHYSLYENSTLDNYLNKICQTLVINSGAKQMINGYHVGVLNTDEINAFATCGGHILITRGLLKCTQSEDALAAVISHELAHIELQHSIKAIKDQRRKEAAKSVGNVAIRFGDDIYSGVEDVTVLFVNIVGDSVWVMLNSGYSQEQEFEADKKALSIMNDSGYSLLGMNDMLLLIKEKTVAGTTGFGKTHPTPDKRIKNLKNEYGKYSSNNLNVERSRRFEKIMRNM